MSRTVLAVVAVAVLLSGASACTQYIKSCTGNGAIATNVDVYSEPAWESLSAGDSYTSYTSFTLVKQITGGTDWEKATLSGITVKDDKYDLCTQLNKDPDARIHCPVAIGDVTITSTATIGTNIPSGELKGTIKWSSSAGEEILCIESVLCF